MALRSREPRQELGHHPKSATLLGFIQATGDDFLAFSTIRKSLLQIKGAKIKIKKKIKGQRKRKKLGLCIENLG